MWTKGRQHLVTARPRSMEERGPSERSEQSRGAPFFFVFFRSRRAGRTRALSVRLPRFAGFTDSTIDEEQGRSAFRKTRASRRLADVEPSHQTFLSLTMSTNAPSVTHGFEWTVQNIIRELMTVCLSH